MSNCRCNLRHICYSTGSSLVAGEGVILNDNIIKLDFDIVQKKLSAGSNIVISDEGVISSTGSIVAGEGVTIDDGVLSVEPSVLQSIEKLEESNIANVEDFNDTGALGLFLFSNTEDNIVKFGDLVDGSRLIPVSMKISMSGLPTYYKFSDEPITGTWKMLSATTDSDPTHLNIVFAVKISQ